MVRIFYNPYHRELQYFSIPFHVSSLKYGDSNKAGGASDMRGNKHCSVKHILIKIDFFRYRSFNQIKVLIQFFVRRSERTMKIGNVLRQKSGILFKLKEKELT